MLNSARPLGIFKLIHHDIFTPFFFSTCLAILLHICYAFSFVLFFLSFYFCNSNISNRKQRGEFFVILYSKFLGVFILTKDLSSLARMLINRACRAVENF